MYGENRESVQKRELPNPQLMGLLMGVVALVAPYGFIYYPDVSFPEAYVYAIVWGLLISPTWWHFEVPTYLDILQFPLGTLFYLILILLYLIGIRILFAYQTVRYFQGKMTRKRLITLGVIAEFPMAVLWFGDILLFVILIVNRTHTSFHFYSQIPIPVMLLLGLLLLRYFPAMGESDWDLKKNSKKWWLEAHNPQSG